MEPVVPAAPCGFPGTGRRPATDNAFPETTAMDFPTQRLSADFCVVGGGIAGLCAALAAALGMDERTFLDRHALRALARGAAEHKPHAENAEKSHAENAESAEP